MPGILVKEAGVIQLNHEIRRRERIAQLSLDVPLNNSIKGRY